MTVFVAVAMCDAVAVPPLAESCVAALRLPGARTAERHFADGFACAGARTRPDAGPLHVGDGLVVAGDVRLDGRADLLRALRGAGADRSPERGGAGSASDLGLVAAAYERWGASAVERLRGDFSFVLWDAARRELLAARDGLGVRPLYHARVRGGLCLSNTLDAVRAHPSVGDAIAAPAIVSFLEHGWNCDTATTTFAAISRLPPGTALRWSGDRPDPAVAVHWRMPEPPPLRYRRDDEYVEHYRAVLDQAVRDRITGDTAILLSGGLDSPSIAVTARRVAPEVTLRAYTTRTMGVESPEESRLAAAVAARAGIAHELHEVTPRPFNGAFPRTPEPFDDPALPATTALLSAIAERSPVVMQGEDGDALFAPPGLRTMLRREPPLDVFRRIVAYTVRHGHHPHLGFWLARRIRFWRKPAARPTWLRSSAGPSAGEPPQPPNAARPEAARRLGGSIWQSVHQSTDRAFVHAPIECRWPLLDTRLLELVFAIPAVPWCQRKLLVRRAYATELPPEVVVRPKRTVPGYFEHLVAEWRRDCGAIVPTLHERTAEYVDAGSLADVLRSGTADEVLAAWRALELDRWFAQLEAHAAGAEGA